MSNKIAIVLDSTASLPEATLKENNIYTSHLLINFGTDAYEEFKTITPEQFSELSKAQSELPTTSQPAIGVTAQLYEDLFDKGYDEVVHVTISSGISGTYQSAVSATSLVEDKGKVHVFDSKAVVFPQGMLGLEAAKLAKAGKSADEIIAALTELRKTQHLSAAVKVLDNLQKGGRLSNAQAVLGGMLQIKPIIAITDEGKLEAVGKLRTFKRALDNLAQQAADASLTADYEIGIMHVNNVEDAEDLKSRIQAVYPDITIHIFPLSLVIAAHVGEGAVAVTWSKK